MDIKHLAPNLLQRARQIQLVLTDCDGVLTDSGVYYGENGEICKRFNIRDGMGVERLRNLAGVDTGIVTGELSASVAQRAQKLGIVECHLGAKDKHAVVSAILQRLQLPAAAVAYIGDDVNDLPAFPLVGLRFCPADAFTEVQAAADLVLSRAGGHGAFRELAEIILHAKASGS